MEVQTDWFTDWFNTPYYHILYKHRGDSDAQLFMQNITSFLQLPKTTHILDLPCGKGRHAVFLNALGYKVTGADLSENSIQYAKQFENKTLHFEVADMRKPFVNTYDAIFNLFTSFGYFEEDSQNINVLKNIKNGLSKNGVAVIDFLNVTAVKNQLVEKELKTIDGIDFYIHKKIENGFIIKEISFEDNGRKHHYIECVKFIDFNTFKRYFKEANLKIKHVFGDYNLNSFIEDSSNRLIFVVS